MAGVATWREIHRHPAAWRQTLERARALPVPPEGGELAFVGVGITYYLAQALARAAEMCLGRSARAIPGQEFFLYPDTTGRQDRVCVFLSRTGDVTDTVRAMKAAKAGGVASACALILGEEGGPAAGLADFVVECGIAESSVATTAALTAEVLAGIAGIRLASDSLAVSDRDSGLALLPDVVEARIAEWNDVAATEAKRDVDQVIFLGTGPRHGIAQAAALTLFEMSLCHSFGYHTLVYPHGHKVNLTKRSLIVAFIAQEAHVEEAVILDELREMGPRVVVMGEGVSSNPSVHTRADVVLDLDSDVDDFGSLPLYPVFAQLLGYHMAIRRGLDPDHPPNLKKVF